jgi:hypothetical protein
MKVRCKTTRGLNTNWYYQEITAGNMYEVLGEGDTYYVIISDKGRHLAYRKELFEVVEEEKMESVIKIKEWKDLNGLKNEKYVMRISYRTIYVRKLPDNAHEVEALRIFIPDYATKEIIEFLKILSFNIEFQKSPLEQVKKEIEKRISDVDFENLDSNEKQTKLYWCGRVDEALAIKEIIERIEKDEPNA